MKQTGDRLLIWIGICCGLVALLGVAAYLVLFGIPGRAFAVEPTHISLSGKIRPDTAFTISTPERIDAETLGAYLQIEPQTPYRIRKVADRQAYRLIPELPFMIGEQVTLTLSGPGLRAQQFQYTVDETLLLREKFPADGQQNLPVATAVECGFNATDLPLEAFERAFSIEPSVPGRFALEDGRFCFFPEEGGLQYGTTYAVTLDGARPLTGTGATLGRDNRFTFTTETAHAEQMRTRFLLGETAACPSFLPDEPPVLGVRLEAQGEQERRLAVAVYRYDGVEQFLSAIADRRRGEAYLARPDALPLHSDFLVALPEPEADTQGALLFPEPLPEGYYLAEVTAILEGETITRYALFQSSPFSVYTLRHGTQLFLWINDAERDGPVSGADFAAPDIATLVGRSDRDGLIALDGVQEDSGASPALFTIREGLRTFVGELPPAQPSTAPPPIPIHSFLTTDRPRYAIGESIGVWGLVRAGDREEPLPEAAYTLRLRSGERELLREQVNPDADGAFLMQLPTEGLLHGEAALELWMDEQRIEMLPLRFALPQQQTLSVSLQSDRPLYATWEQPQAELLLEIEQEGLPAAGYRAVFSAEEQAQSAPLIADTAGLLRHSLTLPEGENHWRPQRLAYRFTSADGEQSPIDAQGELHFLARDTALRAELRDGGSVMVRVNAITTEQAADGTALSDPEKLIGEPVEREVTAELQRSWYEPIPDGDGYDLASRTAQERVRYELQEQTISEDHFQSVGGSYLISDLPQPDQTNGYTLILRTTDGRGLVVEERLELGRPTPPTEPEAGYRYHWRAENGEAATFADGETLAFRLSGGDEAVAGKTFYAVLKPDFVSASVSGERTLKLPYDEQLLPGYTLVGAHFEAGRTDPIAPLAVSFSPEKRALKLTLTPSQERIAPGGTLEVSIAVTHGLTGQPAADALVLLSASDAAAFEAQSPTPALLDGLYTDTEPPIPPREPTRAPAPTAQFVSVRTDAQGMAQLSFAMPDVLTEWKLIAHAVTAELRAGSAEVRVDTAAPFQLLPELNERLTQGDSFSISLRGQGAQVSATDRVRYTLEVNGTGILQSREGAGRLDEPVVLSVDRLPAGRYTATVTGICGSYTDQTVLPFTVGETATGYPASVSFPIETPPALLPVDGMVELVVVDRARAPYGETLMQLGRDAQGASADRRLAARYLAEQRRAQGLTYDLQAASDELTDLSEGGLLRRYATDAATDPALTVRAHLAMPQIFSVNHIELVGAAEGDTPTALLAGALTGRQTAATLLTALEATELDFIDRMYLVAALQVIGDTQAAQRIFREQLPTHLRTGPDGIAIELYEGQGPNHQATAAALMVAALLGMSEADGLAAHLNANPDRTDLYLTERLIYLANSPAAPSPPASFGYTLDGRTQTATLTGAALLLEVPAAQYATLALTPGQGTLQVYARYLGTIAQGLSPQRRQLGVTRTIEPVEGDRLVQGALVKVTLGLSLAQAQVEGGDETLILEEILPAGLRFEPSEQQLVENAGWQLAGQNGQRLTFLPDGVGGWDGRLDQAVYYARCLLPGGYAAEPALVHSRAADLWGMSEADRVTVE